MSVTAGVLALGFILLLIDYQKSTVEIEDGLVRNGYGKGSRTEELEVEAGEEKSTIQVEVPERTYTEEQVQEMFKRCTSRIETEILGENKSLDRIETDMNLMAGLSDEPVEISWELDRYDVMNVYGEIQEGELAPDGTLVGLRAVITYTKDPEKQALYGCKAMIYPRTLSRKEQIAEKIQKEIRKNEEATKTEKVLMLPQELDGRLLRYYRKMDNRGAVLMIMAVLIGILLYALEKQNRGKQLQKKRHQMKLDYPEIISKMTLLLGSGMTVKKAWRKIVKDYEEEKDVWGVRYAYEEMKQTCHEMDSGIMESESYERFGKRCNLQEYVRLGALLSQNLRKGTRGLNQLLKMEAIQAFEERKARAKRLGEEAGTKLLLPMFFMLAVVLVIVIVPAFLSVQLQ